jgi:hypothetical protein
MSKLIDRIRARIRGEDKYVYTYENAPKDDYVDRWNHLRIARRNFLIPTAVGVVGIGMYDAERQAALAQTTTPFSSWPLRSSIGGVSPAAPGTTPTAGTSQRTFADRVWDSGVNVLEFYPALLLAGSPFTPTPGVGKTVMKNANNPLSNFYATLAAAQIDYPFATSLADEIDWHAWQAAFLYIYNRDNGNGVGTVRIPTGISLINRTIQCACSGINIIGSGNVDYPSQIRWNGPDGTKDAPNYQMLFQCTTELGVAVKQLGSSVGQQQLNGGAQNIERILFQGKSGSMTGTVGNESHFISGLRVSQGGGFMIRLCGFGGTLWDGLVFTGALTWTYVERNLFTACYRDAVAFWPVLGNFSTTMHVNGNNFSQYGRYAILLNVSATAATPVVYDNLFEPQTNPSYFTLNPQWFLHGVPASCAIAGCSQIHWSVSYLELSIGNLSFLHILDSGNGEFSEQWGTGDSPSVVFSNSVNVISNTIATWTGTNLTLSGTQVGTWQIGMTVQTPGSATAPYIAQITGTTTAGSAIVTGLSSTSALCPGLEATTGSPPSPGTNIIQGTLIQSVDSSSQITLNTPARLTATQNIIFRLPPGARITGGTFPNFTVSPSLTVPGTIGVNSSIFTPDALAYLAANGYTDTTDTRNFWCGGSTSNYPTSSYQQTQGNYKFSGWGNMHSVGNISLAAANINQLDRASASVMSDYALDPVHGRAALAVCSAGVFDATNGLLTVDASGNSSPFPFGTGQTIYGPGLGNIAGPDRAFGKAIAQISTGGTGSGGAGTYNMAASSPLGASSARAIWAITMTSKDIDSFGIFSGVSNNIWENTYNASGVLGPNLTTSYGRFYNKLEARFAPQDNQPELWVFGQFTVRQTNNIAPSSGTFLQGSRWLNYGAKPGNFEGWICTTTGTIGAGGVISAMGHNIGPTTIANLPTPVTALQGAMACVTDASSAALTFGSAIGSGGGSNVYYVWCNGTAWTVIGK